MNSLPKIDKESRRFLILVSLSKAGNRSSPPPLEKSVRPETEGDGVAVDGIRQPC
jgi:hypothetical protein